jgi:hypothetical protein
MIKRTKGLVLTAGDRIMIKLILVFLRKAGILVPRNSIRVLGSMRMALDRGRMGNTLSRRGYIGLFAKYM